MSRWKNHLSDIMGQKFGYLTVIGVERKNGRPKLICRCDCGIEKTFYPSHVQLGGAVSCGCFGRENRRRVTTSHGHTIGGKFTQEYQAWTGIKKRCLNSNTRQYKDYGGRGIKICDKWLNNFEAFLIDVGASPSPNHTIDRYPNNDGNYEPGNVRWATRKEQNRNKRNSRTVVLNDEVLPVMEVAERYGIAYWVIRDRLKAGWSLERTLTEPKRTIK